MNFGPILANHLLQIKAIIVNAKEPFTWASGMKSPIYCDNRLLLSYPYIRHDLTQAFQHACHDFPPFDVVAGVATAGIAHGAILADKLGLPFIYVRGKAKGHGRQNMIEGKVDTSAKVLVVEDLISTGGSSLAACEALEKAQMNVVGLLSIFSYELDQASSNFSDVPYVVKSITSLTELLTVAHENGLIDEQDLQSLQQWKQDPAGWSADFTNN